MSPAIGTAAWAISTEIAGASGFSVSRTACSASARARSSSFEVSSAPAVKTRHHLQPVTFPARTIRATRSPAPIASHAAPSTRAASHADRPYVRPTNAARFAKTRRPECDRDDKGPRDVAGSSADLGHVARGRQLGLAEDKHADVTPELYEQLGDGLSSSRRGGR